MRADASQFGVHKAVHKMQTAIKPREKFVFELVVDRECDLRAVRSDVIEITDAQEGQVSTHALERILVVRVAVHRQQHSKRLETERSTIAKIAGRGRTDSR